MKTVFIGLGSNLDEPLSQVKQAVSLIDENKDLTLVNVSSFYASAPMGPQDQPDYINAVVEVATGLSAEQLLDTLQEIENRQGRVRSEHWGARTLDLDILLFADEIIKTERLTVPHSGIAERNFVLYPLYDLVDESFNIPDLGIIKELIKQCPDTDLKRLK